MDTQQNQQKTGFLASLEVLYQWRNFIFFNTVAVGIITIIVVFLLPVKYRSIASVLPPKDQNLLNPLGAVSSALRGGSSISRLAGLGTKSTGYNYLAILESRSANLEIVRKFDLARVYDTKDFSEELALKDLSDNVIFEEQATENITIEVIDKDPQRAADMANHYVELLNRISFDLATQEAINNISFLERRVSEVRTDLAKAEDALQAHQEKTGIIIATDPSSPELGPIAELYAMKAKKELELAVLEQMVAKDNPLLQTARLELRELNKKIDKIPGVGIESVRLMRELLIQQKILELVLPMYEQARVEKEKNVPVILVLDKAVPAEKKYRPKRMLITFLVTTVMFLGFVALSFQMHRLVNVPLPEEKFGRKLYTWAQKVAHFYKCRPEAR